MKCTGISGKIVWMDLEMTGLQVKTDRIMEISCLISDKELNILAECPTIIIHQSDALLGAMDDWCTKTHTSVDLQAVSPLIQFNQPTHFRQVFWRNAEHRR